MRDIKLNFVEKDKLCENNILNYLPVNLSHFIENAINSNDVLTEIRLRVNCPLIIKTIEREIVFDNYIIRSETLKNIFNIITEFSAYAYEKSIKNGYITVKGGHRIGICGNAVSENGKIKYINNISYINMRVSREIKGCGEELFNKYFKGEEFENTLIISKPGKGKTTLIRDLIRLLSNDGNNITVIDERNEISGSYKGMSQNNLGIRTDVLSECTKQQGILLAIRSMSPDIVAADEIGGEEDVRALLQAKKCGVKVMATIHGSDQEKLDARLNELFQNRIYIKRTGEYKWL